jgi:cytochrome c biogenesis protein CcdA/glutaredoxin
MRAVLLLTLFFVSCLTHATTEIQLYWLSSCPHCHEQLRDVERLQGLYPDLQVLTFQLDRHDENVQRLRAQSEAYKIPFGTVPVSFVGNQAWVGFGPQTKSEIEAKIQQCIRQNLDCRVNVGPRSNGPRLKIDVPLLGEYNLTQHSLIFSTILIGVIDGFNPCSLWVLSLLMTMIVGTNSRKRIFIIGFCFLLTTAIIYGVFMAGIVSVLQYLDHLKGVRIFVAGMALMFALVNIKDYFWYKKGLSFTIPKKFQPAIYRNLRSVAFSNRSTILLIGFTILIAAGIAIIEFPCTAGFPVIWGQLILHNNVEGSHYLSLLVLYIFFYLIDEFVIFGVVVSTLKASQLTEKHGRFLKLISGIIMLFMAIALIFAPQVMDNILSGLLLFITATFSSLLLHKISQR